MRSLFVVRCTSAWWPATLGVVWLLCVCGCGEASTWGTAWPRPVQAERVVEAGALRICAGTAEVVPLAGPAEGVCLDSGRHPDTCADDAACGPGEQCVCGLCLPPGCFHDGECASGRRCTGDGVCRPACGSVGDCPAELPACAAGVCERPCTNIGGCGAAQRCDLGVGFCRSQGCDPESAECPGLATCARVRVAFDVAEPEVHPPSGEEPWLLWLELRTRRGEAFIAHGRSEDGWSWSLEASEDGPSRALAPRWPWEGSRVGAPSVLQVAPDRWVMAYAGGPGLGAGVGLATSQDGRSWSAPPDALLVPSLAWEGAELGSPGLASDAARLVLFYEAQFGIGRAALDEELRPSRHVDPQGRRLPVWSAPAAEIAPRWPRLAAVRSPSALLLPFSAGPGRLYFSGWPASAPAGAEAVDAGAGAVDAEAEPVDAGAEPVDAGAEPVDAGAAAESPLPSVGYAAGFAGEPLRSFPFNPMLEVAAPHLTGATEPCARLVGGVTTVFFVRAHRDSETGAARRGRLARAEPLPTLTGGEFWR